MSIAQRIEQTHIEPSEQVIELLQSLLVSFRSDTVASRREGLAELLLSLYDLGQIAPDADTKLTALGLYEYLEVRQQVYPANYHHPLVYALRLLLAHQRHYLISGSIHHDRAAAKAFITVWENHIMSFYPGLSPDGQVVITTLLKTVARELDSVSYDQAAINSIKAESTWESQNAAAEV